jgi:LacI family repressor for deo operon, udp, cdd, tsx, nupC, and nupG
MSTIKDVANLAGVSVATVSRVLNEEKNVKLSTKRNVEQAIEALNYSPNLLGRHLRKNKTKNVLVLLPTISGPFYSAVIKGIQACAEKEAYQIMIAITDSDVGKEERSIKMLETKLVDGLILFAPQVCKERLETLAKNYPLVQCCEYIEGAQVSVVSIDNLQAAYDATCYFLNLGHEKIAMITSKVVCPSSKLREQGFRKALLDHNKVLKEEYILHTDYTYTAGMEATKKLLQGAEPPTAIFATSDSLAIGAIKAAVQMGIKVGEEIDIIGFDDTSIAKMYQPAITTVTQPRFKIGEVAMSLLLEKINDLHLTTEFVTLPHELVVRDSTRKASNII